MGDHQQSSLFSYTQRLPKDHPLRAIRAMADMALGEVARFEAIYASAGRPSIAPERLLPALLLEVLYTVHRERLLMEQPDYDFLFRWFVGPNIDQQVWDATVFTKSLHRLLAGQVTASFLATVLGQAPGWRRVTLGADSGYYLNALMRELHDHHPPGHFARRRSIITSMVATPSASASADEWKKSSAGSRLRAGCARPAVGG